MPRTRDLGTLACTGDFDKTLDPRACSPITLLNPPSAGFDNTDFRRARFATRPLVPLQKPPHPVLGFVC
jgi:hypothetical protein